MTSTSTSSTLADARALSDVARRMADAAAARSSELTAQGARIDDHQVMCERLALLATDARAAAALADYAERLSAEGRPDALAEDEALTFASDVINRMHYAHAIHPDDFAEVETAGARELPLIQRGLDDAHVRSIGKRVIDAFGVNNVELFDDGAVQTRQFARQFAKQELLRDDGGEAIADKVHRHDLLVPESWIKQFSELGFFGSSVPEGFGGTEMGYLTMIVLTEELSAGSLIAGSLLTRSEILTRALLEGGTEEQQRTWLPKLASGEVLVGISVTEPDVGSDVASVQCKATPGERGGERGWLINGAKAWCTFAGRANVLALLARTDPDPSKGNRGLSLFIVPKDTFDGHKFEMRQSFGGVMTGEAIPTPGYRGMHSYVLNLEDYFVPAANLVGGE
ncbi:MAG TPA: acyl-CoA dehydrogenase family protein, partial [Gemmatimonadaceae bacterium]